MKALGKVILARRGIAEGSRPGESPVFHLFVVSLRVLSRGSGLTFFLLESARWAYYNKKPRVMGLFELIDNFLLPAEVGKGFVGLGHFVSIKFFLDRSTLIFVSF